MANVRITSYNVCYTKLLRDENENPMWIDEPFTVQLNNSNVKKKFDLYGDFEMTVIVKEPKGKEHKMKFKFDGENTFETHVKKELSKSDKTLKDIAAREFNAWLKTCELSATYYHRHYIEDAEYIPFGVDIESFINKEFKKPIIEWTDSEQLGYEFKPNKFFYEPLMPLSSEEILNLFWKVEEKTETILNQIKVY